MKYLKITDWTGNHEKFRHRQNKILDKGNPLHFCSNCERIYELFTEWTRTNGYITHIEYYDNCIRNFKLNVQICINCKGN